MSNRMLRTGIFLIWAVLSAVLVVTNWKTIGRFDLRDADDALRLVEVRSWLAGQSWFDVTQYRIHPPFGGPMHWSRLVDLPIAGFITLFSLFLPLIDAERMALVATPLFTLLILFAASTMLTLRAGGDRVMALAAGVMLCFSMGVLIQFLPMRIDHHGWQIALDTVAAMLIVAPCSDRPRLAAAAGLCMAVSLTIALEGLPVAAVIAAILAARFLLDPRYRAPLIHYVVTLTAGCAMLLAGMLGWPRGLVSWCDSMSPTYLLPMAAAVAALLIASPLSGDATPLRRLLPLVAAGIAGVLSFLTFSHQCLAGPFSTLDPIVYQLWYVNVAEGMPVWKQSLDVAVIIPVQAIIGIAATLIALRCTPPAARGAWASLLVLQVATFALSLNVMRAMGIAHVLALPSAAWLFVTAFRAAMGRGRPLQRVPLAVGCFFLTPIGVLLCIIGLMPEGTSPPGAADRIDARMNCVTHDKLRGLAALPPATIFAPLDIGPHILAFTRHLVVATGHHRNNAGMKLVLTTFLAGPEAARAMVATTPATYVAFCPGENEVRKLEKRGPASLMSALIRDRPPSWLRRVPMRPGEPIRVYRIVDPTRERIAATRSTADPHPAVKVMAPPFMQ